MMHIRKNVFSWIFVLIILALCVTGFVLYLVNLDTVVPVSWGSAGGARSGLGDVVSEFSLGLLLPVTAGLFGILILQKQPGQRIGWWLCGLAVFSGFSSFGSEVAVYGYFTSKSAPNLLHGLAAWYENWSWLPLFGSILWILAIFPSGKLLAGRWKWWIGISLGFFIVPLLIAGMLEEKLSSAFQIPSFMPFTLPPAWHDAFFTMGVPFMPISVLVIFAAVTVRFRQQGTQQKQQFKWLLVGVAFLALLVITGLILAFFLKVTFGEILVNISFIGPLFGVGMAILRYRLYDVDLVLRRTLQYAILTSILALVYFGSIALLQGISASLFNFQSPVVTVITTLGIAALFTPLRQGIQEFIDRRFYRSKYDAEQALAQFAAAARSETDVDTLTDDLLGMVDQAMKPEQVSLWFKGKPG